MSKPTVVKVSGMDSLTKWGGSNAGSKAKPNYQYADAKIEQGGKIAPSGTGKGLDSKGH